MLLVPKQLQRVGMTGMVPYYGGRLSPAQAYGAAHPTAPPPNFANPVTTGGAFGRAQVPTPAQSGPPEAAAQSSSSGCAAMISSLPARHKRRSPTRGRLCSICWTPG